MTKVRALIAGSFTLAIIALTFMGKLTGETFMTVATAAILWWFNEDKHS